MNAIDGSRVEIWWSDEYGHFIAEMPEIPGCLADGATQAEALDNALSTAEAIFSALREDGREVPQPQAQAIAA